METEIQFKLRLPVDLKERLALRAERNGHSISAEIVQLLSGIVGKDMETELLRHRLADRRAAESAYREVKAELEKELNADAADQSASGSPERSKRRERIEALKRRRRLTMHLIVSAMQDGEVLSGKKEPRMLPDEMQWPDISKTPETDP